MIFIAKTISFNISELLKKLGILFCESEKMKIFASKTPNQLPKHDSTFSLLPYAAEESGKTKEHKQ